MNTNTKHIIAGHYVNLVKSFFKRSDVLSGKALGYRPDKNKPLLQKNWFNFGDALVTTGFCVCVSQALLEDEAFQTLIKFRGAKAKLVSIDIKEQFFGYCKPSYMDNKWHTAILLEDSGFFFIIDPTCAQFGNAYVGKLVWDLQTWLSTFRSATDKHILTDFNNLELKTTIDTYADVSNDVVKNELKTNLHDIVLASEEEKQFITDFLLNGYKLFNKKKLSGELKDTDLKYINFAQNILSKFKLVRDSNQYTLLAFDSKDALKKFCAYLLSGTDDEGLTTLPFFCFTSNSEDEAIEYVRSTTDGFLNYNSEWTDNSIYLMIKWNTVVGSDTSKYIKHTNVLIPAGTQIFTDLDNGLYNLGSKTANKHTNTWVLECSVFYDEKNY